ncbi:nitrogenase component 1 [Clostridium intestinale]|uniref:nitrogenase component 1 n=1 Tax=Clostridium intestinale TaxID=36845 RepID=UPI0028EF126F|nr:nitrogenase component 1 [Clostridium intestinale]
MITEDYLSRLNRLSDIDSDKAIISGTTAIYPGTRCPIAPITSIVNEIEDAYMLVVGTAECTYYNKNISIQEEKTLRQNKVWSYSMNSNEVVFGCRDGVYEALKTIKESVEPKVIFLVSACVPEMIGEDFESIVDEAALELDLKVIYINGAHFKCYSAMPAEKNTVLALCDLMEKQDIEEKSMNIIGSKYSLIKNSEFIKLLESKEININSCIPFDLSVDKLKTASKVKLNIVTDLTYLPIAKRMQEDYGIQYIIFNYSLEFECIKKAYLEIGEALDIDISREVQGLYEEAAKTYEHDFRGKSFGTGYLGIDSFGLNHLLTSLGMKLEYMEIEYYFEENEFLKNKILESSNDPLVGRSFDYLTLKNLLKDKELDYFIGAVLDNKNIGNAKIITPYMMLAGKLGFEAPLTLLKAMKEEL